MTIGFLLVFNSIMLGFGLAMDAFSVSLANGFADNKMSRTIFGGLILIGIGIEIFFS